jgi:hypothetical protein
MIEVETNNNSETITTMNPGEEHWSTSIVGDNAERAEALKQYESPDQFLQAFDQAQDWRRQIAGDDDKYYSTLQRFNTPTDFGNSFREAQQTIRSGNLKASLDENASPEVIQAYREANGIPLEAKGYVEKLPEGLVLGEEDQEAFMDYAERLHNLNVSPEVVHESLAWYNEVVEQQQAATMEQDQQQRVQAEQELREAWGADFQPNMNAVQGFLNATFGEEAKEQMLNGRFPDGRAFMNDPNVLKALADVGRRLNPMSELTPQTGSAEQSMNDEIAELEKYMREDRTKYNNDVTAQERLRKLYEIRIKNAEAG